MEYFGDYLTIEVDKDKEMLCSHWIRIVSSSELREGMQQVEQYIAQNNILLWLSDLTRFTAPSMQDQKWAIESLTNLLENTNLKKIALVLPGDYILHMIVENLKQEVLGRFQNAVQFECFSRPEHALHWLNSTEATEAIQ